MRAHQSVSCSAIFLSTVHEHTSSLHCAFLLLPWWPQNFDPPTHSCFTNCSCFNAIQYILRGHVYGSDQPFQPPSLAAHTLPQKIGILLHPKDRHSAALKNRLSPHTVGVDHSTDNSNHGWPTSNLALCPLPLPTVSLVCC